MFWSMNQPFRIIFSFQSFIRILHYFTLLPLIWMISNLFSITKSYRTLQLVTNRIKTEQNLKILAAQNTKNCL